VVNRGKILLAKGILANAGHRFCKKRPEGLQPGYLRYVHTLPCSWHPRSRSSTASDAGRRRRNAGGTDLARRAYPTRPNSRQNGLICRPETTEHDSRTEAAGDRESSPLGGDPV